MLPDRWRAAGFESPRHTSQLFELAERPDGVCATTDEELAAWTRMVEFQASRESPPHDLWTRF